MTLHTGVRLGSYEIRGPLGAGGMGEVYRAWDERLAREVAIKVLPESAASDPDRLRRFDQEARAAGTLNHPNVLAVYDVGSHDSGPYIVSELLEGDTLRTALGARGLTPRKAVEYAIQIARGLSAAHKAGIVHRDVKPENVFLTRDGQVKILDFGLAKLRDLTDVDPVGETATKQTEPGAVMGTVPYMSPEQVRGLPADARSDIFALGSVLYEMLAGRRAFVGETASEVETAILREEPTELAPFDSRIPPALDRLVRRCLEKRAEDRFETARDVAFALETVATRGEAGAIADAEPPGRRPTVLALLAALLVGLLGGAALVASRHRPIPPPSYTQLTFRRGTILSARFSHDGQTVVYSAAWDGQPAQVYTTRIGSPEARPLDIEGIVLSVSSKDEVAVKLGRFWKRNEHGKDEAGILARFPLAGGAPRELLDDVTSADWDPEGRDLAVVHDNRLEYPIGHVVYSPPDFMYFVRVLPGARFAFMQYLPGLEKEAGPFALSLVDHAGAKTTLLQGLREWRDPSWSPMTQELLFTSSRGESNSLLAVSLAGRERLVARIPGDFTVHDVDPRGRILLEQRIRRYSVFGLPPGESRERDLSWLGGNGPADLSADGRQMLFMEYAVDPQALYLRKTEGSPAVKLGEELGIALSPDGRSVLALPGMIGSADRLVLVPTGAGSRRELRHASIRTFFGGAWFPDGRRIAVIGEAGDKVRVFVWDVEMSAPPRPLSPEGRLGSLVVSPEGGSVVVADAGTGLTICPVDGGPARSLPGGAAHDEPLRWSGDGRWLYVRRGEVPGGGALSVWIDRIDIAAGTRRPWRKLMPADPTGVGGMGPARITPDGKTYVYSFGSSIGSLYLVDGLQ